jgi:hypothetical protein
MSVRNGIVLLAALSMLLFLAACGNGNTITNPVAPPSGNFSNSNLKGTYVFSVSGTDANGYPFAMLGTFTANGNGGITAGAIDINDPEFPNGPLANSPINNNSTYSIGPDGRGLVTLGVPHNPFGNPSGANIILDCVLADSTQGLVTAFDTNYSGSGTLDLQASGAAAAGSYAFSLSGISSGGSLYATVGNFALSGGAFSGLDDLNESGLVNYAAQALTGSLTLGPSSTPSTTFDTAAFNGVFDTIAVDSTHLKLIEMDSTATLSGDAYSQTSSTTTIAAGTLAFTLDGIASSGAPLAAGGFMVTDGAGNITTASTEDYNSGGSASSNPGPFSATYTAAGTGRYTLANFATFVPGNATFAAYPSSGGLLLLEDDDNTPGTMTFGAAYPQTAGATFAAAQGYALNLSAINLGAQTGAPSEVDDIAEFTANSSGATVTGIIDENSPSGASSGGFGGVAGGPNGDLPLDGNYAAPDSTGRGQISVSAGNANTGQSTLNGGFLINFYTTDGTTFPFIESDSGQVGAGIFLLQNPSGSSAAIAHSHMFVPRPIIRPHTAKKKN